MTQCPNMYRSSATNHNCKKCSTSAHKLRSDTPLNFIRTLSRKRCKSDWSDLRALNFKAYKRTPKIIVQMLTNTNRQTAGYHLAINKPLERGPWLHRGPVLPLTVDRHKRSSSQRPLSPSWRSENLVVAFARPVCHHRDRESHPPTLFSDSGRQTTWEIENLLYFWNLSDPMVRARVFNIIPIIV